MYVRWEACVMVVIERWVKSFRKRSDNSGRNHRWSRSDIEQMETALRESRESVPNRSFGCSPSTEGRIMAAWGNLSIEEPDFTLEDARRFSAKASKR